MNPVDFAKEIFGVLGVYSDAILTAWYNLYKTGDAKYFTDLINAADNRSQRTAQRAVV